jgi:hypothetical protein
MRELAPNDSIAYAVDRVGTELMAHMLTVWRATPQPTSGSKKTEERTKSLLKKSAQCASLTDWGI